MTEKLQPQSKTPLSPNKQALLKIRELKQQLADAQRGVGGPRCDCVDGLPISADFENAEEFLAVPDG